MAKPAKTALPRITVDATRLHEGHPTLRAEDWRSPLVSRLIHGAVYADGKAALDDAYRDASLQEATGTLDVSWQGIDDDYRRCVNTYQDPVLTELATLGLSCMLIQHRAGGEITEVCRRGDKVDYWIGEKEYLLEVSGQKSGNLDILRDNKASQLLSNPFETSGYVCVANYANRTAYLWYYEYGGV